MRIVYKEGSEMWIVIYGSLFDGIKGVVGPFESREEAEKYIDSHNLGHFEKAAYKLEA